MNQEAAIRFSDLLWRGLAGFAWKRFLSGGRGCVLVPESSVAMKEGVRIQYMTGCIDPKVMDAIKDYEPAAEVVVVFVGDAAYGKIITGHSGLGDFFLLTVAQHPRPPLCMEWAPE